MQTKNETIAAVFVNGRRISEPMELSLAEQRAREVRQNISESNGTAASVTVVPVLNG